MKKRVVLVGLLSVAVWWCRPSSAGATVLINEVLADPPASIGDANHDGVVSTTQDEFVELINTSAVVVSLANWKLSDAVQVRHTFSPIAAIPAYGFYLVFGGGSPVGFSNAAVASSGGLSLNNTAETVILKDATSLIIDTLTYGAEGGADVSLTRSPDGVGSFVKHTSINANRFSPGSTVDGLTELPHEDNPDDGGEESAPVIPEPSSLMLLGSAALGLLARASQRQLLGM